MFKKIINLLRRRVEKKQLTFQLIYRPINAFYLNCVSTITFDYKIIIKYNGIEKQQDFAVVVCLSCVRKYLMYCFSRQYFRMRPNVCEQWWSAKWHVPVADNRQHRRRIHGVRVHVRGCVTPESLRVVHFIQPPKHATWVNSFFHKKKKIPYLFLSSIYR